MVAAVEGAADDEGVHKRQCLHIATVGCTHHFQEAGQEAVDGAVAGDVDGAGSADEADGEAEAAVVPEAAGAVVVEAKAEVALVGVFADAEEAQTRLPGHRPSLSTPPAAFHGHPQETRTT